MSNPFWPLLYIEVICLPSARRAPGQLVMHMFDTIAWWTPRNNAGLAGSWGNEESSHRTGKVFLLWSMERHVGIDDQFLARVLLSRFNGCSYYRHCFSCKLPLLENWSSNVNCMIFQVFFFLHIFKSKNSFKYLNQYTLRHTRRYKTCTEQYAT